MNAGLVEDTLSIQHTKLGSVGNMAKGRWKSGKGKDLYFGYICRKFGLIMEAKGVNNYE